MNKMSLAILFMAATMLVGCQTHRYIIPVADGEGPKPSPPSITGVIGNVSESQITIEVFRGVDRQPQSAAQITPNTRIFTAYGGYVELNELRPGQRVKVWFTTEHPIEHTPIASVVMIASTNPHEGWPK